MPAQTPIARRAMRRQTKFFVVAASGCYGDETRVISSHYTPAAAKAAARRVSTAHWWAVARAGELTKGELFFRDTEPMYPIVT